MEEIVFLTLDEVMTLHADIIAFAGGADGLRSSNLLQGALAQAEAGFGGTWANSFPFGMAAAYAFHLARNHAFVDGNKRIGLSAAVVFLHLNGWELDDPHESLHPVMEDVAAGKVDKAELAKVLEGLARPLSR